MGNVEVFFSIISVYVVLAQSMLALTLAEEHWLRVFQNRLLMIFRTKNDEVTSGGRRLHKNPVALQPYRALADRAAAAGQRS